MAKLGEGDARWIVSERDDGANVHGWHWVEKDCAEWSRLFFERKFVGFDETTTTTTTKIMEKEEGFGEKKASSRGVRLVSPVKVTGEAYLNQRKGKIIAGYELEISVEYECEGEKVGTMVLPYVSDENKGERTEVKFNQKDESEKAKEAKKACESGDLRKKVQEVVKEWEDEMARGTPAMKREAEENSTKKKTEEEAKKDETRRPKQSAAAAKIEHEYKSTPLSTKFYTIKLKETFLCRATDVCEALLDPRRVMHFTRTKCTGQKGVGKFDMFDGSVCGETIEFIDGERIVQKWRFNSWEAGHYSTVTMVLKEPDAGNVVLELVQTNVPEADAHGNENVMEVTENGWKNLIFARIRNAFGYGANL